MDHHREFGPLLRRHTNRHDSHTGTSINQETFDAPNDWSGSNRFRATKVISKADLKLSQSFVVSPWVLTLFFDNNIRKIIKKQKSALLFIFWLVWHQRGTKNPLNFFGDDILLVRSVRHYKLQPSTDSMRERGVPKIFFRHHGGVEHIVQSAPR